jgi:hypothetical protein
MPVEVDFGDASKSHDCSQRVVDLTEMLIEVRDEGLIYWEPNTERGRIAKARMLDRINRVLNPS